MRKAARGFSLIEVMIAVTIVGILAAISYPAYQQYVLRTYRVEAIQLLLKLANAQEHYYADHNQYQADLTALGLASPYSESRRYQISMVVSEAASAFSLLAVARAEQAADRECPSFQLNHYGQRNADVSAPISCWQ